MQGAQSVYRYDVCDALRALEGRADSEPLDGVMNMRARASSERLVACAYLSRPVCGMVGMILIRSSLWVARGWKLGHKVHDKVGRLPGIGTPAASRIHKVLLVARH